MNYKISSLLSISALVIMGISPVYASGIDTNCSTNYGSYGNNTTCEHVDFVVNKTVADPTTVGKKGQSPSNYQDNWGINADKYVPGQQVPYQISVTNTGTKKLNNITIKDTLPEFLTYASGGSYDKKSNTVTFTLDKLDPNETKKVDLIAQVVSADNLPNTSVNCTTNKATALANDMSQDDTAQICILKESVGGETKGGLKVFPAPKAKKTPPTGPEALALIPLIGSAFGGMFLRKKSSR